MSQNPDVIIIGTGVIGAATAFELAKLGYKTLSLDRNTQVAGIAFHERFPIAKRPLRDMDGREFRRGDLVALSDPQETEFARGLTAYDAAEIAAIQGKSSADIEQTLGYKYVDEVIHRDDLVVL